MSYEPDVLVAASVAYLYVGTSAGAAVGNGSGANQSIPWPDSVGSTVSVSVPIHCKLAAGGSISLYLAKSPNYPSTLVTEDISVTVSTADNASFFTCDGGDMTEPPGDGTSALPLGTAQVDGTSDLSLSGDGKGVVTAAGGVIHGYATLTLQRTG